MAKQNRSGTPIQCYVPEELRQALEALARANGRNLSDEMRAAFRRHIAGGPLTAPPLAPDPGPPAPQKKRGRPRKLRPPDAPPPSAD